MCRERCRCRALFPFACWGGLRLLGGREGRHGEGREPGPRGAPAPGRGSAAQHTLFCCLGGEGGAAGRAGGPGSGSAELRGARDAGRHLAAAGRGARLPAASSLSSLLAASSLPPLNQNLFFKKSQKRPRKASRPSSGSRSSRRRPELPSRLSLVLELSPFVSHRSSACRSSTGSWRPGAPSERSRGAAEPEVQLEKVLGHARASKEAVAKKAGPF